MVSSGFTNISRQARYTVFNVIVNLPNPQQLTIFIENNRTLLLEYFSKLDSSQRPISHVLQAIETARYLLSYKVQENHVLE